jgi:peptidoglycan/xylan/chitin deacetylase (PgdA/CDA1 family)
MSLDRILTTTVFQPLRRARFWDREFRVPILMYHGISQNSKAGSAPAAKTATDSFAFRQQMRLLITNGCNPADLSQVVKWLRDGVRPPDKTVIITFDDGLRDFHTHAFPVLHEHSFPATVFLPTDFIGASRRSFNKVECMTWSEVRDMHKAGVRFGSHTVSHSDMAELPRVEVMRELGVSKAEIERHLGEPVAAFAYPHRFPRANSAFAVELRDLLVKAGYSCCVTEEVGRVKNGDDLFRLKRIQVNAMDSPALFRAKLEGGYDWMARWRSLTHNFKVPRRKANPVS